MTQVFSPAKLRALRIERGFSRVQLSIAVQRDFWVMGNWERGKHVPNGDSMHKLCEVLDCELTDLFEDFAAAATGVKQRVGTAKPKRARGATRSVDSASAPARSRRKK